MNDKLINGLAALGLTAIIVFILGWLFFNTADRLYCTAHHQDGLGDPGYCKKCYSDVAGFKRCNMRSLAIPEFNTTGYVVNESPDYPVTP